VVEHSFGLGRVIQFSSTGDSEWNDFCARPLFVPFLHRCLGALLGRRDDRLNIQAGEIFTSEMPLETAGKTARITLGGGPSAETTTAAIRVEDGAARLRTNTTNRAGSYAVYVGEDAISTLRFAAQPDPAESNLEPLSPSAIKALETVAQITRSAKVTTLHQTLLDQRNGAELWLPLTWILLGLAVSETLLGNRWSRSK
jgi:hypothetical protein